MTAVAVARVRLLDPGGETPDGHMFLTPGDLDWHDVPWVEPNDCFCQADAHGQEWWEGPATMCLLCVESWACDHDVLLPEDVTNDLPADEVYVDPDVPLWDYYQLSDDDFRAAARAELLGPDPALYPEMYEPDDGEALAAAVGDAFVGEEAATDAVFWDIVNGDEAENQEDEE